MTEVGRQPWAVFGLLRTSQGTSPTVTTAELWTTVGGYGLVYLAIAGAAVHLFVLIIRAGPSQGEGESEIKKLLLLFTGTDSVRSAGTGDGSPTLNSQKPFKPGG
jgi:cytochrome d ubiquinol oxidase subunit I